MMARHYDDQSKQDVFFISTQNFLKEIEKKFSVFLSSYIGLGVGISISLTNSFHVAARLFSN